MTRSLRHAACGFLCGAITATLVWLGIAVIDVQLPDDWDQP
jgi:hypothetical protein